MKECLVREAENGKDFIPGPLWYEVDETDTDLATFFYFLGGAARIATPRRRSALPLFTPQHQAGARAFARMYFRMLERPAFTVRERVAHDND